MQSASRHLSSAELEQGLPDVLASPRVLGRLEAIVVRPAPGERRSLATATLTPERGINGDRWGAESSKDSSGAPLDPRNQVSLMNSRILRQIAGREDAVCLAGDNLILDFDFSEENLPTGSRIAIGLSVTIEITDVSHTGCGSFAARYGNEARAFINSPRGNALHLRGCYARILTGGTIAIGDEVRKTASC
jgi:MOSC domain